MEDQQLFTFIIVSIVIMVGLALGVLLLYNTSRVRILEEVQSAHAKELEYKNKLLSNTVEVQEEERSRIAKELHDDIGSKLSIVNLNVNLLKTKLGNNQETAVIIDQIESSLTESITRARDISHDLYPPILAKFGIQSALESLASSISRTGVLRVHLDIEEGWKELSKSEELHVYRICQELLHNTIKHAEANNVWVSTRSLGSKMQLRYLDDGKGLAYNTNKTLGLGLSSIHTRVSILKAEMLIDTAPSKGYQVQFIF